MTWINTQTGHYGGQRFYPPWVRSPCGRKKGPSIHPKLKLTFISVSSTQERRSFIRPLVLGGVLSSKAVRERKEYKSTLGKCWGFIIPSSVPTLITKIVGAGFPSHHSRTAVCLEIDGLLGCRRWSHKKPTLNIQRSSERLQQEGL